jgi:ABC-type multidrug transport system fused ATPase/permease subunit
MENKTGKYLKYAIGEIVLVVIGILIALQINNWNEIQKANKNEVELLNSLKKELIENIEHLTVIRSNNNTYKNSSKKVKVKLAQKSSEFTSEEISNAFNYYSSTIDSPVLNAIIESNSNSLVQRKTLIKDLTDLKETYRRIEKSEYFLDELWNSKITDFFISCGFSFESYSSQDSLIKIEDIELGGYTRKQLLGLVNMKNDLQQYCDKRHSQAYTKSEEVLKLLQSN